MMSPAECWSLIHLLRGAIDGSSLLRLRCRLEKLDAVEVLEFGRFVKKLCTERDDATLLHADGSITVGDGRLSMVLAVVATGREGYENLLAAARRGRPMRVDVDEDEARGLGEMAREIYESTGRLWPFDDDLPDRSALLPRVSAYVPGPSPRTDFADGVHRGLERWAASEAYPESVGTRGLGRFVCYLDFRDPESDRPGSRWRGLKDDASLEIRAVVDPMDYEDGNGWRGPRPKPRRQDRSKVGSADV